VNSTADIKPGDFYEDCACHPCLCIQVEEDGNGVNGISLVDGSVGRGCSIRHCGIQKLTHDEAIDWIFYGPLDEEVRTRIKPENRWWEMHSPQVLAWYRPRRMTAAT
jgi:hypothetical protein